MSFVAKWLATFIFILTKLINFNNVIDIINSMSVSLTFHFKTAFVLLTTLIWWMFYLSPILTISSLSSITLVLPILCLLQYCYVTIARLRVPITWHIVCLIERTNVEHMHNPNKTKIFPLLRQCLPFVHIKLDVHLCQTYLISYSSKKRYCSGHLCASDERYHISESLY